MLTPEMKKQLDKEAISRVQAWVQSEKAELSTSKAVLENRKDKLDKVNVSSLSEEEVEDRNIFLKIYKTAEEYFNEYEELLNYFMNISTDLNKFRLEGREKLMEITKKYGMVIEYVLHSTRT